MICIYKMEEKIMVLNWFTMKFIDWYITGEMLQKHLRLIEKFMYVACDANWGD